jgi:tetratricopeptide (TPR) repeat protein
MSMFQDTTEDQLRRYHAFRRHSAFLFYFWIVLLSAPQFSSGLAPAEDLPDGTEEAREAASNGAFGPSGTPVDVATELVRLGQHRERGGRWGEAERAYARILLLDVPVEARQEALLAIARMHGRTGDYVKSAAAYEKFARLFPGDIRLPEVFLEAGLLYREIGLPELAIAQFYKVMNSSLRMRADQFDAYRDIVLRAQVEIAETQFQSGNYREAASVFGRLMQLEIEPALRPEILFKWGYSHFLYGEPEKTAALMRTLLHDFGESPRATEARYLLVRSLQAKGRSEEAMTEGLKLLREREPTALHQAEEEWRFWQRAMGNPIANEFYRQGDYQRALAIYQALARLDRSPEWLWPVVYQIGLCFERLRQEQRALDAYRYLTDAAESAELDNPGAHLETIVDMARWRKNHLDWQLSFNRAVDGLLTPTEEAAEGIQ